MADQPHRSLSVHEANSLAARWAEHLQHDRRQSKHTVRAYVAIAHRLIEFLGRHRGEAISESGLLNVPAADLRGFLASRRAEGIGASSAARELSGVRAFLKYAASQAGVHANVPRTRAPKRPRTSNRAINSSPSPATEPKR